MTFSASAPPRRFRTRSVAAAGLRPGVWYRHRPRHPSTPTAVTLVPRRVRLPVLGVSVRVGGAVRRSVRDGVVTTSPTRSRVSTRQDPQQDSRTLPPKRVAVGEVRWWATTLTRPTTRLATSTHLQSALSSSFAAEQARRSESSARSRFWPPTGPPAVDATSAIGSNPTRPRRRPQSPAASRSYIPRCGEQQRAPRRGRYCL